MAKNLFGLVAVVGLFACGAAPQGPDVAKVAAQPLPAAMKAFAIDPDMPTAQAEVVRDVARAWCESEHQFCLVETTAWALASVRVHWATNYAQYGRHPDSCAFTVRVEGEVRFNADRPICNENLHTFWIAAAHEFGHLAGLADDQPGWALMAAEPDWTMPLEIL
jgi:hypothetical protein